MIHVIATIQLNAGTREAYLKEFLRLTPLVRAEAGCIEYGATIDEPTPSPLQNLTLTPWTSRLRRPSAATASAVDTSSLSSDTRERRR